ncbi:acyl-CoA dehydrogenase [Deinococcus peraridilitoris]|uniref:Acyl-CoA dehydrogenase n=1 Tax=Deinococcus peraridilitoris (strain DSM 19664 / LMG 22246 / CIP 109416 / KR-200) TaxID=937777 RepID=L0A0R2_DEIPD|nr:acyl-CoA dehydrogenase [Deinococcus peraridilitoris]AFZ66757.1 acyl-CoA dehydrogenase [Deinococcus peraridilitoris DSM 19664]
MPAFVNRRDIQFMLYELLGAQTLPERELYEDHSRETFDDAINLAYNLAEKYFAPHNREADLNEPHVVDGKVQIIAPVKEALEAFRQAGFFSAHHRYDLGGLQLPSVVSQVCHACFQAANIGTSAYPFLTIGNANLLEVFGSDEQKAKYLPHLLSGRFYGTMALSEPQAGSGLADILTTATPREDGTYSLSGTKMWISAGEHELSENIVHLVLARIKGAPKGVKGISLFIVPRFRVNEDGSVGEHNDVNLGGLLHKMGYRGTTSTVLNFGENGNCLGELVGEPHKGLMYMFHMMNGARIGVGMGATMLGYAGYLYSLEYAQGRPQGRKAGNKDPHSEPVMIIEHPDVKRMLLMQKAYVEGAFALGLQCALLEDDQLTHLDEAKRQEAALLLDILTPIVKAWPSEYCLEANKQAIQILGGYGYTREYPVEQYYRDNRLNPIHEGTNGIQALDLLGRKVIMGGGAAFTLLSREIEEAINQAREHEATAAWAAELEDTLRLVQQTTQELAEGAARVGADLFLANAHAYLEMFGHTVIAWMWLRQAVVAARALEGAKEADRNFYQGKLAAARFFFVWELPKTRHQGQILRAFDRTTTDMQAGWFA